MLEHRWPGAQIDEVAVAHYREAMRHGRWILNGMPIILSGKGVLLDGVQRLLACVTEAMPLRSFVAREVNDDVLPTIDQHSRRGFRDILAARGAAHPQALTALVTRLIRYDDTLAGRVGGVAPSWLRIEHVLNTSPGIEEAVAESLAMAGSPLPEPFRTAILYLGLRHDKARTIRLLKAVWHPHRFEPDEPGAALRSEIDRERDGKHRTAAGRERIFALALKALQATLDGQKLRQLAWQDGTEPGRPAETLPALRGYRMLAPLANLPAAMPELGEPQVTFETIDQARAAAYLQGSLDDRGLNKAHLDALTRDILARRWMANPQPICFSASGRLVNGRHRLMAVIAAHESIDVPVVRGVAEEAFATYDIQNKRAPLVRTAERAFGDEALVAAMANLLWRQERRGPNTQARTATAAEIQRILLDHPRLREMRGLARRMIEFGRASVMGYGAFVIERDDPVLAPVFLRGLETGADLPRDHPILALRAALPRLRGEGASQERQLATLLDGWRRFKLHADTARAAPRRAEADRPRVAAPSFAGPRPASSPILPKPGPGIANAGAADPPGALADLPPGTVADGQAASTIAELLRRKRQQSITASFGRFVMGRPAEQALLQEAARVAADGLGSRFSKVLQYEPRTDSLLLRAGMGWPAEAIGTTRFEIGSGSPAGFAFTSGRPIFSDRIATDSRFTLPPLLKAHGIIRQVNVVIGGEGAPFGVLEVDDNTPGRYDGADVSFLAALASSLGLALELARDSAERDELLLDRDAAQANLQHRVRNSLQLVHTVLTLQADDAEDEAARKVLEFSAQRILTIAMVTERIYQTERQEAVELGGYLTGLIGAVRDGLSELAQGRSVALDAASTAVWPSQRAELLGLVLAELLISLLQHGRGAVLVRFSQAPPVSRLEVSNQEPALPADQSPEFARSAGVRIAAALLRENGGALTVNQGDHGLQAVAEFPWPGLPR